MNELVDKIASPSVKPLLERQLNLGLDTPCETPDDHAKMLREGDISSLLGAHCISQQQTHVHVMTVAFESKVNMLGSII